MLSLTYQDLFRHVLRESTSGLVYGTGTVTVASGVVTLTGGTFPSWAATGTMNIEGSLYTVASRDGNTQVTLDDTSVSWSSAVNYLLIDAEEYEAQQVEDAIQRGQSQFYQPPPLIEGMDPHIWSFLSPTATLSFVSGKGDYDLPDDYGQVIGDFAFTDGSPPMSLTTEMQLRSMRRTGETGTPRYFHARELPHGGTSEQKWELMVHPVPDRDLTVEYSYHINPQPIHPGRPHPYGGAVHSNTLLYSCLDIAERQIDGVVGGYAEKFRESLSSSIQFDVKATDVSSLSYAGSVIYGSYEWFQQEVGEFMGLSPNFNTWSHPETEKVHHVILKGLKRFYLPQSAALPDHMQGHRWSFLRKTDEFLTTAPYSTGTVTISSGVVTLASGTWPDWARLGELEVSGVVYQISSRDSSTQLTLVDTTVSADAGASYELSRPAEDAPDDFGGRDSEFTYRPGTSVYYGPVKWTSPEQILGWKQDYISTDQPEWAALRAKTENTTSWPKYEILFYPTPDALYRLTWRYRLNTEDIGPHRFPYGGEEHAGTMLESCLSVAEGGRGPKHDEFLELLAGSITRDLSDHAPDYLGRMTAGQTLTSDDYFNGGYVTVEDTLYD